MAYIENFASKLDWAMPFQRTGKFPLDRSSMFESYADALAYAKQDGSDKRALGGTSYVGQLIVVYGNDAGTLNADTGETTYKQEVAGYIITGVGESASLMKLAQTTASGDFTADINNLQTQITDLSGRITALNEAISKLPKQDTDTTYTIETPTWYGEMSDLKLDGGKITLNGSDGSADTTQVAGWQALVEQLNNVTAVASGKSNSHVYEQPEQIEFQADAQNPTKFKVGDIIYFKELYIPDYWVARVLDTPDPSTGYYYEFSDLEVTKIDLNAYLTLAEAAVLYATKQELTEGLAQKADKTELNPIKSDLSELAKKVGNVLVKSTDSEGNKTYYDLQSQIGTTVKVDDKTGEIISLQDQIDNIDVSGDINDAVAALKTELTSTKVGGTDRSYITSIEQQNGKIIASAATLPDVEVNIIDAEGEKSSDEIDVVTSVTDNAAEHTIDVTMGYAVRQDYVDGKFDAVDQRITGIVGDADTIGTLTNVASRVSTLETNVTGTGENSHATRISALETAIGTNSTTGTTISSRLQAVEGTVKTQGETILDHSTRIGDLEGSVKTLTETTIPNLQNNVSSRVKEIQINGTKQTMTADGVVNITEITTDVLRQGNNILLLDCLNAAPHKH